MRFNYGNPIIDWEMKVDEEDVWMVCYDSSSLLGKVRWRETECIKKGIGPGEINRLPDEMAAGYRRYDIGDGSGCQWKFYEIDRMKIMKMVLGERKTNISNR